MRRRVLSSAAILVALGACTDGPDSVTAPYIAPIASQATSTVDDRYIVVFRDDVGNPNALTDALVGAHGGAVHLRYGRVLKGFAATLPPQALQGIRRNPNVAYIEPDGVASVVESQNDPPSWGLDRIDQESLPLNDLYTYGEDGSGVTVYVIDTGMRFDHQEFAGRASSGWDFVDGDGDASDCHGHGTHVGGTVAGETVGVAKGATIKSVRVLNCSGSGYWSWIIAGIDWVTSNHQGPSVANMSLGGGFSNSVNQAVANSVAAGVVFAVAAGNENRDACTRSPASATSALTVGATTTSDSRASYSNFGSCLDVFAPGSGIRSSTQNGTATYASWSGTSMASPHVAGVAALYLSAFPGASAGDVSDAIVAGATNGVVSNTGNGSPNLLLFSLLSGVSPVDPPDPPEAPVAPTGLDAVASSTSQIRLDWNDASSNEDGFEIQQSTGGSSFSTVATLGAGTTTYTRSGLAAGTEYSFRVRSYNDGGESSWAGPVSATTDSPPLDVAVHVGSVSATMEERGRKWWGAALEVSVHQSTHGSAQGVTVGVSWSGAAGSGSGTCVTNSAGSCSVSSDMTKDNGSIQLTVTDLSGSGFQYSSGSNHLPVGGIVVRP